MSAWAQFYTPQTAGRLLVSAIGTERPETIVDIGVGRGQLLREARARWREARLFAADIDPSHVAAARKVFPGAVCHILDALHSRLPDKLGLQEGQVDVAVCNPPYLPAGDVPGVGDILRSVELHDCVPSKRITTDIVFIAQNLRLLRPGGELAVIVPDGLATQVHYRDLRQALLERHGLYRVIQMPDRFFARTEARTHIFYLRKAGPAASCVRVTASSPTGELMRELLVSPESAGTRLDYSFLATKESRANSVMTLRDAGANIIRGAFTHKECKSGEVPFFHSTDFKRFPDGMVEYQMVPGLPGRWVAEPGDILIPRVGARCLHHAAKLISGNPVLTDCVYRIRVAPDWRELVWQALSSDEGIRWRNSAAHGVCARVLGKELMLDFPLFTDY